MKLMRVLVVDDEEHIRNSLANMLAEMGHQVTSVSNGHSALELIRENSEWPDADFDLLITDRRMPGGMLGEEVIRNAKLIKSGIRAILMTGEVLPVTVTDTIQAARADAILAKPLEAKEVKKILEILFD